MKFQPQRTDPFSEKEASFKTNNHSVQIEENSTIFLSNGKKTPNKKTIIACAKWYAIYTRSRCERKVFNALQKSGFEAFLPLIKEKRIWSDRIKSMEVPLLPGYVFVKTQKQLHHRIYPLSGFVRFVSFEGKPCEVRDTEIQLMEDVVVHGLQAQQTIACQIGDWVRIVRGPLKGREGRIESKRGHTRIVFLFEFLQQAISVEVGMGDVEGV